MPAATPRGGRGARRSVAHGLPGAGEHDAMSPLAQAGHAQMTPRSSFGQRIVTPGFLGAGDQGAGPPPVQAGHAQVAPKGSASGGPLQEAPSLRSRAAVSDVISVLQRKLRGAGAPPVGSDASTAASTAESSPASPALLWREGPRGARRRRDGLDSKGDAWDDQGAGYCCRFSPGDPGSATPASPSAVRVQVHSTDERSEAPQMLSRDERSEASQMLARSARRSSRAKSLLLDRALQEMFGPAAVGPAAEEQQSQSPRIRVLAEGEKIYDLYHWSEVLQEQGNGGKVVVCTPKAAHGDRSSLPAPSSPPAGASSNGAASGKEADVMKIKSKVTWEEVVGTHVMKIKSKADLQKKSKQEDLFRMAHLKLLNMPPHMGVVPLHEILEDEGFFYVVMEKATGGSLLNSLVQEYSDGVMPEKALKSLMQEILSAVGHLHEQGMLHRDIKADNLVVHFHDDPCSPTGRARKVMLIDFDFADPDWIPQSPGRSALAWAGTLQNSAPETLLGTFSQRSDLYGVGTVLYLLMAGRMPHDDGLFEQYESEAADLDGLRRTLTETPIDWRAACWERSPACRDFCMWLLDFDPDRRPACAAEAARHRWFTEKD